MTSVMRLGPSWVGVAAVASLAVAGCGAESSASGGAGAGGTSSRDGVGGSAPDLAMVTNGECTCRGLGVGCYSTLSELCERYTEGCPATLATWLDCADRGQISEAGRFGYVQKQCEGQTVIYYVFGFGDTVRWVYGADGQLVGAGNDSDAGQSWECGAATSICGGPFADYEPLSGRFASDAGSAAVEPRAAECASL
jgi:hypothetical protein